MSTRLTRSSRVLSVKPDSDSRTKSKPRNGILSTAYKSVFGPSKAKLESIARFRGLIKQADESLNKFIDRNQPDIYADISRILEIRTRNYENLSKATRLTAEDIAADEEIRARIKKYRANQRQISGKPDWRLNAGGTRKRRKYAKKQICKKTNMQKNKYAKKQISKKTLNIKH